MLGRTVAVISLTLLACAFSSAQGFDSPPMRRGMSQIQARFTGTVRGQDGSPLSNAQITMEDMNTGMRAASAYANTDGSFEIDNLPPGEYEVVATSGTSESRQRIELLGGETSVEIHILQVRTSENHASGTVSVKEMEVPDKARQEFEKAEQLVSKKKLDEARQHLDNALTIYPNFADALTLRGLANMQEQKTQEAETDLENAIKTDPEHGPAYVMLGALFNSESRFDDALRELDRGVTLEPGSWQAHFEISRAKLGEKDFAASLREVTKASSLARMDYPVLHIVKANALIGLRDYKAAVAELKTYLDKEPAGPNSAAVRQQLSEVQAVAEQ